MDQSAAGRLEGALRSGQFAITAEITPPVSIRRAELIARGLALKGLADAVNVTDGAGAHVHPDPVAVSAMLVEAGIEPVLQLACRDRNRIALQGALLAAAAAGVRNLLLLRGDDPSAGDEPTAKAVFDLGTRELLAIAAGMRDRGVLSSGRAIGARAGFFVGCADSPIDPAPGWAPDNLKAKIAAGAQFAQTQICMDAGVARRYAARLAQSGIVRDFPLLVGVVLFRSARSARWIAGKLPGAIVPPSLVTRMESASDPHGEGERIAFEMIADLAATPGVAGVHVMAPGHDDALAGFLTRLDRNALSRAHGKAA